MGQSLDFLAKRFFFLKNLLLSLFLFKFSYIYPDKEEFCQNILFKFQIILKISKFWYIFQISPILIKNLRNIDGFFLSCRNFYFLPSNFDPSEHLYKVENCLAKNKSYDMIERIHRYDKNLPNSIKNNDENSFLEEKNLAKKLKPWPIVKILN
jgi:hypothetical protein